MCCTYDHDHEAKSIDILFMVSHSQQGVLCLVAGILRNRCIRSGVDMFHSEWALVVALSCF